MLFVLKNEMALLYHCTTVILLSKDLNWFNFHVLVYVNKYIYLIYKCYISLFINHHDVRNCYLLNILNNAIVLTLNLKQNTIVCSQLFPGFIVFTWSCYSSHCSVMMPYTIIVCGDNYHSCLIIQNLESLGIGVRK